jgi:hypothetical protein
MPKRYLIGATMILSAVTFAGLVQGTRPSNTR